MKQTNPTAIPFFLTALFVVSLLSACATQTPAVDIDINNQALQHNTKRININNAPIELNSNSIHINNANIRKNTKNGVIHINNGTIDDNEGMICINNGSIKYKNETHKVTSGCSQ